MKFIINETGKLEEIRYIDQTTDQELTEEIIGNSGAIGSYIHYNAQEDAYNIDQDSFDWWQDYFAMYEANQAKLNALIDQYGADAVNNVIIDYDLSLSSDMDRHDIEFANLIDTVTAVLQSE